MNKKNQTRRQFILKAGKASLAATVILPATTVRSLCGCNSQSKHDFTIGLSMYSLRFLFKDDKLDVLSYPRFAKETFDIVNIDTWEGGIPQDKREDPDFYRKIKNEADEVGSDIFLHMAGVIDATGKTKKECNEQVKNFFPIVDRAAILGCQFLRIFLRAPKISPDEASRRCAETLYPLAEYARKMNLSIAIEPGASDLTKSGEFLAQVMDKLKHPNCVLMPDFGKLSGDIYKGTQAMMPYSKIISAKSHNFDKYGNEIEFDYFRLINIIVDSGFSGIIAIEYEGQETPPIEGVQATKTLINKAISQI